MGFSTNYDDVKDDYGLIPEGEYEAVIRNIEERTTKKGATGLNLSLVIRNDVEQSYKDRYLFCTYWKRKEPTQADMQVQGYSFKQIMRLAKSAKLPSGKAYENVKELCEDLLKRPLRVTVEHTAHRTTTSHNAWEKIIERLAKAGFVEGEDFKTTKQFGLERIEWLKGDGVINFRTRSSKGGGSVKVMTCL